MSRAARTVLIFGIYAIVISLAIIFVPNVMLGLFGFEPTDEVWIRVLGTITLVLGVYYLAAARGEDRVFFRASLVGRPMFFVALVSFVVAGLAKPTLMLFGLVDLATAVWTGLALRADARATS